MSDKYFRMIEERMQFYNSLPASTRLAIEKLNALRSIYPMFDQIERSIRMIQQFNSSDFTVEDCEMLCAEFPNNIVELFGEAQEIQEITQRISKLNFLDPWVKNQIILLVVMLFACLLKFDYDRIQEFFYILAENITELENDALSKAGSAVYKWIAIFVGIKVLFSKK